MASLSDARIASLLAPYLQDGNAPAQLVSQLSLYLHLLLRWNTRTNLTAVRSPEQIVQRHIGESLFAARLVPPGCETLLDFGSGAGFPGIPIQLLRPDVRVTLAESQGKKASFLREAVRVLALPSDIWAGRVEEMPCERMFGAVTLRAVDRPEAVLPLALNRMEADGLLLRFLPGEDTPAVKGVEFKESHDVPQSKGRLAIYSRVC